MISALKSIVWFTIGICSFCVLTYCAKAKGIPAKPVPKDIIDTNLGRVDFYLNNQHTSDFHCSVGTLNNKIVLGGYKLKNVGGQLVPFHYFSICIAHKELMRQRIFRIVYGGDPYSDNPNTWANMTTAQDDGDVACEIFDVDQNDSTNNFVQMTKEKNNYSEIWGNYSMTFVKTSTCSNALYPEVVQIRNGYFHVYVK
jgi:hypothetical protein